MKNKNLLTSSVNELRFALLQIQHLQSILQEIEVMTNDVLAKSIIKNGLERHERNFFLESIQKAEQEMIIKIEKFDFYPNYFDRDRLKKELISSLKNKLTAN